MIKSENGVISLAGDGDEILEDYKKLTVGLLELVPFRLLAKTFREGIGLFAEQSYEAEEGRKKISSEQANYMRQIKKMNLIDAKKFVKEKKLGGN